MKTQNGKLWSTLNDGKFELRSMTLSDLEESLKVLDNAFFINESVCKGCEINLPHNSQAREDLKELSRITAQDGVSLFVRHLESGRIVAVAFNKLQFAPPPGEDTFFVKFRNEQVKSPSALRLMDYMIAEDAKIDVLADYNMDCVCELMFLATLPEFGRLGLGTTLTKYTIELSRDILQGGHALENVAEELRDKRPAAVNALWTSEFTHNIGKAVGFKVLNKTPYTEFEFNGKRFDERIGPQHKFSELAMYKL
ncbi:uncharacterized protein LOC6564076 [Drosophila grimshawi]|uniref:uncharacterized protein LOC6564076 n=1 Tax=Drosophila grimshawi TaxID=7222 RepID=UPI000C86EBDE|nr:uncharacterized protein LOC6564076 [Drosophila grimshawi]